MGNVVFSPGNSLLNTIIKKAKNIAIMQADGLN